MLRRWLRRWLGIDAVAEKAGWAEVKAEQAMSHAHSASSILVAHLQGRAISSPSKSKAERC